VRPTNIILYQADWCGYCARVRAKLAELQLDYKKVDVPAPHAERTVVREVSGQTSIPVMVDGDVVLTDDDDIIPYLEKIYGQKAVK
jgi:glutathione S-transferase